MKYQNGKAYTMRLAESETVFVKMTRQPHKESDYLKKLLKEIERREDDGTIMDM